MLAHRSHGIESLEARRLLSASVFNGTLDIFGSSSRPNSISVTYTDSTKSTIQVIVDYTTKKGVAEDLDKMFPAAGITGVLIRGGNAADTIDVGQNSVGFDIKTLIDTLGGANSVTGAGEDTTVNGGSGNDTIMLGNGNDIVRGEAGADVITVGNGTDKVDGGAGNDTIVAGSGNDTINGGAGDDIITANDVTGGGDLVHGGPGNDSITCGNGNDTIWGDNGNDTMVAGNGNDTFGCISGDNTVNAGTGDNTYYGKKSEAYFESHNTTDYNPSKDTLIIKPAEPPPPVV